MLYYVNTTIFNGLEALLLTHSNLQLRSCHQVTLHDIYDRWRTITHWLPAVLKNKKVYVSGGYIYFLTDIRWMTGTRQVVEQKIKQMQEEGIWRWVLMKESPDTFYEEDGALVYAFKVLK